MHNADSRRDFDRLFTRYAECAADENAVNRQCAPCILLHAAATADDEYLYAERRSKSGGNDCVGQNGLYAVNFDGGQVDITNGQFVFSAALAYRIENGRITAPVKGATLSGSGPEALKRIRMIGNDMALDAGVGVCGKEGQSVPVGVGQPTLRLDRMIVGGTI